MQADKDKTKEIIRKQEQWSSHSLTQRVVGEEETRGGFCCVFQSTVWQAVSGKGQVGNTLASAGHVSCNHIS